MVRPVRQAHLALIASVLTASSCSALAPQDCCWLELKTFQYPGPQTRNQPEYNSSLLDSSGLAGIEASVRDQVFRARDFKPDSVGNATAAPRIRVPEAGRVSLLLEVVQGGEVVASDWMEWTLQEDTGWRLEVERAPRPFDVEVPESGDEGYCGYGVPHPCQYERIPVAETMANYPGEAVWLLLIHWDTDPPDGATV